MEDHLECPPDDDVPLAIPPSEDYDFKFAKYLREMGPFTCEQCTKPLIHGEGACLMVWRQSEIIKGLHPLCFAWNICRVPSLQNRTSTQLREAMRQYAPTASTKELKNLCEMHDVDPIILDDVVMTEDEMRVRGDVPHYCDERLLVLEVLRKFPQIGQPGVSKLMVTTTTPLIEALNEGNKKILVDLSEFLYKKLLQQLVKGFRNYARTYSPSMGHARGMVWDASRALALFAQFNKVVDEFADTSMVMPPYYNFAAHRAALRAALAYVDNLPRENMVFAVVVDPDTKRWTSATQTNPAQSHRVFTRAFMELGRAEGWSPGISPQMKFTISAIMASVMSVNYNSLGRRLPVLLDPEDARRPWDDWESDSIDNDPSPGGGAGGGGDGGDGGAGGGRDAAGGRGGLRGRGARGDARGRGGTGLGNIGGAGGGAATYARNWPKNLDLNIADMLNPLPGNLPVSYGVYDIIGRGDDEEDIEEDEDAL